MDINLSRKIGQEILKLADAEYMIMPDFNNTNEILFGVISKSINASAWHRWSDTKLKEEGIKGLFETLKASEAAIVYQNANGLINRD